LGVALRGVCLRLGQARCSSTTKRGWLHVQVERLRAPHPKPNLATCRLQDGVSLDWTGGW